MFLLSSLSLEVQGVFSYILHFLSRVSFPPYVQNFFSRTGNPQQAFEYIKDKFSFSHLSLNLPFAAASHDDVIIR